MNNLQLFTNISILSEKYVQEYIYKIDSSQTFDINILELKKSIILGNF